MILVLVRISVHLGHIWGSNNPKTSKKGYFMDSESVRKTLKACDLTTTNAILMKLTTIMYLHESVNQKSVRARSLVFWINF